jgi:hypothetical protein
MARFDPALPLDRTPPFVRWTLALGCALREHDDYFDPERTERLLRGVRCYSDALAEGRVRSGIVCQREAEGDWLGFDVAAVLAPFGGEEAIAAKCSDCPANAFRRTEPLALAGCAGLIIPPEDDVMTWHKVWLEERPTREALLMQCDWLAPFAKDVIGLSGYLLAIDAALEHHLPLIVRAYPGGRCEERRWYVDAHCDRCKAAWPEAKRQQCRICGQVGGRQPERRRMRIGIRPYRPLREFLTPEQIAGIVG